MIHQVKVFDKDGKLKEIINPIFNYEADPVRKKKWPEHKCANFKCENLTQRRNYCSKECSNQTTQRREQRKREEARKVRPDKFCEICKAKLTGAKQKYCSKPCDKFGRKLKETNMANKSRLKLELKRKELANGKH